MADSVNLQIGPAFNAEGKAFIVVGFHNEHFSQAINLPFTNYEDAEKLSVTLSKAVLEAALVIEAQKTSPIVLPN